MSAASVPAPVRLASLACLGALLAAMVVASRANGAEGLWTTYLAPSGTCPGENDAAAPLAAQSRTIGCLVNWARRLERRGVLRERPALRRAAEIKGEDVASCGQFSHTPCGTDVASAAREAGYRYRLFGENLFAGPWGRVTPREVVAAWLRSPPHRANLLGSRFRDVGVAPARAPGLLGQGNAVVWTAAFATPG